MDELVEVVEGRIGRLRGGDRGHGDDQRVDAESVQGIELAGDGFVVGGSVGDLIEDGLLPPEVGVEAGPAMPGRARVCAAEGRAVARRRARRRRYFHPFRKERGMDGAPDGMEGATCTCGQAWGTEGWGAGRSSA